ncbi:hypothetical protein WDW37_13340 [Bdellovibrionota bacterium FG-1]
MGQKNFQMSLVAAILVSGLYGGVALGEPLTPNSITLPGGAAKLNAQVCMLPDFYVSQGKLTPNPDGSVHLSFEAGLQGQFDPAQVHPTSLSVKMTCKTASKTIENKTPVNNIYNFSPSVGATKSGWKKIYAGDIKFPGCIIPADNVTFIADVQINPKSPLKQDECFWNNNQFQVQTVAHAQKSKPAPPAPGAPANCDLDTNINPAFKIIPTQGIIDCSKIFDLGFTVTPNALPKNSSPFVGLNGKGYQPAIPQSGHWVSKNFSGALLKTNPTVTGKICCTDNPNLCTKEGIIHITCSD